MASIGSLVVNFAASTQALESGVAKATRLVAGFGRNAAASIGNVTRNVLSFRGMVAGLAGATGVGGLLKLGADAETLSMQFKVLTGSAKTAATLMSQIQQFAASTPFESTEIATAARQLLAFGSGAGQVVSELRMLGDIAAGVGVPLGDIAEIYGKARVQGRLFAEDINQLTGRGIPIIGALAKQFGVADSEIRGLVEAGRIGFPEMQAALASMTEPGGQFAGMMEQLSTTTAGKFSTFLDNVKELGRTIGGALLPAANAMLDWANSFQPQLMEIGAVIGVVFENGTLTITAMLETLSSYTAATFEFLMSSAEALGNNIKIALGNALASIENRMRNLGEVVAYYLGLSDEIITQQAPQMQRSVAMPNFAAPNLGPANTDLAAKIADRLQALQSGPNGAMQAIELQKSALDSLATPTRMADEAATAEKVAGQSDKKTAAAMTRGSAEAYSAILQASQRSPEAEATKEQTKALLKPLQQMAAGIGNLAAGVVVKEFAGAF
jgi:tape measure domain-containing protein